MPSRRPKATAKVQGASIISLLWNSYGKSGLFKAILVKTRKTCTPLVIFRPFSLLCGSRFANSVSNLPLVSLKSSGYVAAFCAMSWNLYFNVFKRYNVKPFISTENYYNNKWEGDEKHVEFMEYSTAVTYLDIQLKFVKIQATENADICEARCNSDIFPLEVTCYVPLGGWPYDHLNNFTEFIAFAVFW